MRDFLIVDDHEIVRTGVKQVLAELYFPCTIYEAHNEKSALQLLKERNYHLVLLDVQLPDSNALSLVEYIRINQPQAKVLIFSMGAENIYAMRFLKAGAMGFVSKKSGLEELKKGIDLALNNRRYISDTLAEILATESDKDRLGNPFERLTVREMEIANLLINGKSVSDIGEQLHLSVSTVGTHKARLFDKLGIENLAQLIELNRVYQGA
jgi:two-component system invasion response regulator UvrY